MSALAVISLAGSPAAETRVVINEFKSDTPGADTGEFLELFAYDAATGEGVSGAALDGYVVVFFNGGSDNNLAYAVAPVGGTATAALHLDGRTTNAAGLFVIGSPDVVGSDVVISPGSTGWLQNGPDAVALYQDPSIDFTTRTGATRAGLVDAIVYGTDDPDDIDLLESLTPGGLQLNETPNSTQALARLPDGGPALAPGSFAPQAATPGSLNQPTAALTIVLTPANLTEGATREATVTRSGNTVAAVPLKFASSDPGEASAPAMMEIPPGAASVTVAITAVDDLWPDGPQPVEITATAPGYVPAAMTLTVNDNDDAPQPVIINEVFPAGNGDANLDGANATKEDRFNDEFVEIVNRGAAEADLSGYQLFISSIESARHTFPAGTVLPPGAALVVFGGGSPAPGLTQNFGTAWVQLATAPALGLYLLEPSAGLSLQNADGQEVASFRYDHQPASADSVTLSPDVTGVPSPHASLGDGSIFYSPGTRADGSAFLAVTARLAPAVAPSTVAENAGPAAATLTVQRQPPFTHPLVVTVLSSDTTEAVPATPSFTIPAGQASASLSVDTVDDSARDGPQLVTLTCIAAGHLNGTATLQIDDDGLDSPPIGVFINEIDTDQPGADTGEFIELYVGEPAERALDGHVVVLFNGNSANNGAYLVIDLSGYSSDARGFFVIGNARVPNVDLILPAASIQNGPDAVAVYRAPASSFVTAGNPNPPTIDALVDAVVYGNGSGEDLDLLNAFQKFSDPPAPPLAQQNEGDPNNPTALARRPDATTPFGLFTTHTPTPGASNTLGPAEPPAITLAVEGKSLVLTFTGTLEQSSTLLEQSFAPVPGATSPYTLPLPAAGTLFFRATTP